VSTGGPDLFVICKSCGAEVSPYITECPYCGNRLKKRAPKLDRNLRVTERSQRTTPRPSLSRLRRGEIPGIRHDAHPYATILLVVASLAGTLLWRTGLVGTQHLVVYGHLGKSWWRIFVAPFVYANTGYAFVGIGVVALFGTLIEHRHGPIPVVVLFLLGGCGGLAVASETTNALVMGGNGAALALLTAWAMPDLLGLASGEEIDGDLLGTAVLAAVVALMPLAARDASWIADVVGVAAGVAIGYPMARIRPV
jgi:membrane associated rhomboid family serine protease